VQHNGLPAERFAALADIEAEVVEAVLTALRAAEIAAYAVPAGPSGHCRLWVDEAATSSARDVLNAHATGRGRPSVEPDDTVDDTAWADIIAAFHASPDAPASRPPEIVASKPTVVPAEEHFEPPAPPPLPTGDTITRLAWAGLIGGPAYLFGSVLAGWVIEPWIGAVTLGAFTAGFITLVARMHNDDEPRDDDGAVV
jgi:hypothetical protein